MQIGIAGILTILFVIGKMMGAITWSWWLVLAPLWAPLVLLLVIFLVVSIIAALVGGKNARR